VKRRNLGRWPRRTLRALAEVILPDGDGAPRLDPDGAVDFIDEFVPHLPRLLRLLFPIGIVAFELGALLLAPSLVPFSSMGLRRRQRYVASWTHARSRVRRELVRALKGLMLLFYYSDPRVQRAIGYGVEEFVQLRTAERLRLHGHELH
jgi:hypothetical protein